MIVIISAEVVVTCWQQNFDDFTPFGGWKTPYMKQVLVLLGHSLCLTT
jgi:hypothetical protein